MNQPGKIVIKDNKVYFEPDGLEKPDKENYYGYICNPQRPRVKYRRGRLYEKEYQKDMKEYEASKQLIEVENWVTIDVVDKNCSILLLGKKHGQHEYMWDKDSCEAEVENNIATIIKIS